MRPVHRSFQPARLRPRRRRHVRRASGLRQLRRELRRWWCRLAPRPVAGALALAITTAQPSPLFPDLPTVAQSGVPGYESGTSFALFALAGTPPAVIARLNEAFVNALNRPEVKQRLSQDGQQVVGSTPEQLAAKIRSETARLQKVIPKAGIKSE